MVDTSELRRLAASATPGPWFSGGLPIGDGPLPQPAYVFRPDGDSFVDVQWSPGRDNDQYADAEYIATANPSVMLALLDVVDAARELDGPPGWRQRLHDALARLNDQ